MATPVPVVSMMYFLVSIPPKTFTAVSPAFSAMSLKFAMLGLGALFCVGAGVSVGVGVWERPVLLHKTIQPIEQKTQARIRALGFTTATYAGVLMEG